MEPVDHALREGSHRRDQLPKRLAGHSVLKHIDGDLAQRAAEVSPLQG